MTAAVAAARRFAANPRGGLRFAAGAAVAAIGAIAFIEQGMQFVAGQPAIAAALRATAVTALATALGAAPVLFLARISSGVQQGMLAFSGGIMLAASIFTLLLPALGAAATLTGSALLGGALATSGLVAGVLTLAIAERALPHRHLTGVADRGALLVAVALALHNLPEGLAVGVAAAGGDGAAVTLGIALQNVPEGLVVATAFASLGASRVAAVAGAIATGLVEPLGGIAGAAAAGASAAALPWALAFAAGAMLFVVGHEILPGLRRRGGGVRGAAALAAGVASMIVLDAALA